MMGKITKLNVFKLITALSLATIISFMQSSSAFAYSNSNMIDDAVFDDYTIMSLSQIRQFINERPNTCLAEAGNIFAKPLNYFDYDSNNKVDAARVVYIASQYWEINPQVILATLQKEQSLLTDNNCQDSYGNNSLKKAMGYGCFEGPGAECPLPQYSGFSKQVMKGSWQLKFNKERAIGNIMWNSEEGDQYLTYSGPFTEGTRQTSINSSIVYYDGYWTIDGQSIKIKTGGTASLYSYTPHLNQSFPGIFETYFGSPTGNKYYAQDYFRYKHQEAFRQTTLTGELWYKNVGNVNWYDSTGVSSAPAGTREVRLYTAREVGRKSIFGKYWNGNRNVAAYDFSAVYESDGTTLAPNQHVAEPGQIVKYNVVFRVQDDAPFERHREYFQPSVFQRPDLFNDPGSFLDITVVKPEYEAEDFYRCCHTDSNQQNTVLIDLWYKNVGNVPWYDNTGASSAPAGSEEVRLYTSRPVGQDSLFSKYWVKDNLAALDFSAVYESDGTTLAPNQHVAQPGQIVAYEDIPFRITTQTPLGKQKEFFQPSVFRQPELFNDPNSFISITVSNN